MITSASCDLLSLIRNEYSQYFISDPKFSPNHTISTRHSSLLYSRFCSSMSWRSLRSCWSSAKVVPWLLLKWREIQRWVLYNIWSCNTFLFWQVVGKGCSKPKYPSYIPVVTVEDDPAACPIVDEITMIGFNLLRSALLLPEFWPLKDGLNSIGEEHLESTRRLCTREHGLALQECAFQFITRRSEPSIVALKNGTQPVRVLKTTVEIKDSLETIMVKRRTYESDDTKPIGDHQKLQMMIDEWMH